MPSDRSLSIAIELIKKSLQFTDMIYDLISSFRANIEQSAASRVRADFIILLEKRTLIRRLFKNFNFPIKFITRAVKKPLGQVSLSILIHSVHSSRSGPALSGLTGLTVQPLSVGGTRHEDLALSTAVINVWQSTGSVYRIDTAT